MIDAPTDEFAVFYLFLNIAALFVAVSVLFILQRTQGVQCLPTTPLQVSPIAYLVGGRRRVIQSALASLAQRDAVRVVGGYIEPKEFKPAANVTLPEQEILAVLAGSPLTPGQLYRRCKIDEGGLQSQLREAGLAPTDAQLLQMRLTTAAIASLPAIAGVIRLLHRLPQHRPVILLGMLCLVPVLSGALLTMIPIYANRAGLRLLKSLRAKEPQLRDVGYRKSLSLSPTEIGRAVAMYGMRALRDSHLSRLADLIDPPLTTSDGGSGGDSSSDGGGHSGGGFSGGDAF